MLVLIFSSCKICKENVKPNDIYGCTDQSASNYDSEATIDDGNCNYCFSKSSLILLSTDGGQNWNIRCIKDTIGDIVDVSMADSNNIWLCTNANANHQVAQILYTNDGGRTWEEQHSYDNSQIGQITYEYIEMFDQNKGIAFANNWVNNGKSIVLKTINGGEEWETMISYAPGMSGSTWHGVDFVNINVGYYIDSGVSPSIVYKTIDSGKNWEATNFVGQAKVIKFFNENIGIVSEWDNHIQATHDGGSTWQRTEIPLIDYGNGDIEYESDDPNKIWFLSNDGIIYSNDGGNTWIYKCSNHEQYKGQAISIINSKVMLLSFDFKIGNIESCGSFQQTLLPEYINDAEIHLAVNSDFDNVGDAIIVIPGFISE